MNIQCPYCEYVNFIPGMSEGDDEEVCVACGEWFRVEVIVSALSVEKRRPEPPDSEPVG